MGCLKSLFLIGSLALLSTFSAFFADASVTHAWLFHEIAACFWLAEALSVGKWKFKKNRQVKETQNPSRVRTLDFTFFEDFHIYWKKMSKYLDLFRMFRITVISSSQGDMSAVSTFWVIRSFSRLKQFLTERQ